MTRKKTTLYVDDELWRKMEAWTAIQDKTLTDFLNKVVNYPSPTEGACSARSGGN